MQIRNRPKACDRLHRAKTSVYGLLAALLVLPPAAWGQSAPSQPAEQTLHNGIRLPSPWPPRNEPTYEPMAVPYLASPPAVIPIDVGRQLFVDDFLIDKTTLKRTFHPAEYYKDNPVLKPDKPWEQTGGPTAMVFSDGAWYDPKDRLFKMWYMGGYVASTCCATSKDGIAWEKPSLDVKSGTNIVQPDKRDSSTVWLDLEDKDPNARYKLFRVSSPWAVNVHYSSDGIHWGEPVARSPGLGDRTTVFYNPFRKVWVYGIRISSKFGRARSYFEAADAIAAARWKEGEPVWWIGADRLDTPREDLKVPPQLYNLDAVAYESLILGLFTIWTGQGEDRPKPNQVLLGFSRDGFHWDRPCRKPFAPVSERQGDWNWGNVQSCGGGCLVVGDKLYFYVSGRKGVPGSSTSGESCTGLAILRRDGFASMDANESGGELLTRPLRFSGKHMFVNAAGDLRVEVMDADGRVMAPFSAANCAPIRGDSTLQAVQWEGADDLGKAAGKTVHFRFLLSKGRLYSFWVSPEKNGASRGYVGAGGPGFSGPTDTVGRGAYDAVTK